LHHFRRQSGEADFGAETRQLAGDTHRTHSFKWPAVWWKYIGSTILAETASTGKGWAIGWWPAIAAESLGSFAARRRMLCDCASLLGKISSPMTVVLRCSPV
jgi:hypothetical protein